MRGTTADENEVQPHIADEGERSEMSGVPGGEGRHDRRVCECARPTRRSVNARQRLHTVIDSPWITTTSSCRDLKLI